MNTEHMIFTGAVTDTEKPTHFNLAKIGSVTPIPDEYMTSYVLDIYHQHMIPSCGAHAGSYIKNLQEGRVHSPEYLWKRIKQEDHIPPTDGTSMEFIFKTLQKWGVCSIDLMANNTLSSLSSYTDPSTITQQMNNDAEKSKIGAYAFMWSPTIDQLKRAIFDFKGVIMRIGIGSEWWTPSWAEKDILPLRPNKNPTSGHFVVAIGYLTITKTEMKGLEDGIIDLDDLKKKYIK